MASYAKKKAHAKQSGKYGSETEEAEIDNSKTHVGFWKSGSPFSNWHSAKYQYEGHTFANSEQGMMWSKAVLFGDKEMENQILETSDPKSVKAFGSKVKGFSEKIWKKHRCDIMYKHCYAKFSQNDKLKKHLYNTGTKILVEASPYDKIWGIGMLWNEARYVDSKKWKGLNLLGKTLTSVREKLREEDAKKDTGMSYFDHRALY